MYPLSELLLDNTKLPWHYSRVEEWEAGYRIAPISIDMALTRACPAACRGCYAMIQESGKRSNITIDHLYRFLEDCSRIGVKAISLVSDGESTVSRSFVPFVQRADMLGIDVGLATNGWLLKPQVADQVLPLLKWIRFTALAGRAESYTRMMYPNPSRTDIFDAAVQNITYCVTTKRQYNFPVTLGVQTFLQGKDDEAEILPFAKFGCDLGVDYALIKHMSDDESGSLGVNYADYQGLEAVLKEAEGYSNEKTAVVVRWNKIRDADQFPYKKVHGPQFLLQISGSGLVAPAGQFFNRKYAKYWIGDFTETPFYDIWKSERYWEVMRYLTSDTYDAKRMMGTLPIQHNTNIVLDKHLKGTERIQPVLPSLGPEPLHVNFV